MPIDPDDFDKPGPPVKPRAQTSSPPPPNVATTKASAPPIPPPAYNPPRQSRYQPPPASSGIGKKLASVAALALVGGLVWFVASRHTQPLIPAQPSSIARLHVDAKILSAMSAFRGVPFWLQQALPGRNIAPVNYPPPENVRTNDRCPGEGCGYHRWLAMKELPLFDAWNSANPQQVYMVADRETITALSGVFITTKPGVEEILEPLNIGGMEANAGDLVYPLMSLGEGWVRAFFHGQVLDLSLYAGSRQLTRKIREYEAVWWAEIKTSTGAVGWTNEAQSFSGQSESSNAIPYVISRNGQLKDDRWDFELEFYVPSGAKDASIKIGDTVLPWESQEGVQKLRTGPILKSGEIYVIELFVNNGQQLLAKAFLKTDAPQPEPAPSSPPPSIPVEPQASNYIPVVNATIKAILFYESGFGQPPKESRRYEKRFATKGTRYINWELGLAFPRHPSDMTFAIESVWYSPSGAVLTRHTTSVSIYSERTSDWLVGGWGSAAGGTFSPGTYRVDFLVGGMNVSTEAFDVYEGEAQPSMYIQSIDATVSSLRFFPSSAGVPPKDQRRYSVRFARSQTSYVNWELKLRYPSRNSRTNFTIKAVWTKPDGTIDHEDDFLSYIDASWTGSYHNSGWGNASARYWQTGTYRVDLYVDNGKVATGQFEVVE
jgi:hypothetical protein